MGAKKSRARFPARFTIQTSVELSNQLREVAQNEYGGDLQALMRETLQARVDGKNAEADQLAEVLQAIDQLRRDAGRDSELERGVGQLLEDVKILTEMVSLQRTEIMAARDAMTSLEKDFINLKEDFANRTVELIQQVTHQGNETGKMLARVSGNNDAIANLIAQIASEDDAIPSDAGRAGLMGLFSRRRTTGE